MTDRSVDEPAAPGETDTEAREAPKAPDERSMKPGAAALAAAGIGSAIASVLGAPAPIVGGTIAGLVAVLALYYLGASRWPSRVFSWLLTALAIAVGAFLGHVVSGNGQARRRFETVVASNTSVAPGGVVSPFRLRTSFLAYDTAWGKTWRKNIEVAPTDLIKLQLRLQNIAAIATPDLVVGLLQPSSSLSSAKPITSESFQPGFYVAGTAGYPTTGSTVTLHATTPAESGPPATESQFATSGSVSNAGVMLSSATQQPPEGDTLETTYNIGVLAPGAAVSLTFTTSLWASHSGALAPGDQTFVRELPSNRFSTHVQVTPDAQLQFRIRLADDYFGQIVLSRIAIKRLTRSSEAVTGFATSETQKGVRLGTATVSSSGTPIRLEVTPHTTTVRPPVTNCDPDPKATALPDGISEGGISAGIIGGLYRPRDPCNGREFDRLVEFDASVTR